ncbi:porin [Comamonas odontotermitis]|uniref:porin n=1 Tax=Comamonas TaxID=283 RepID=UPI001CC5EAFB|nr:porin [Comamonas odontotermitis]UBB17624.1 porin [Comamonas odontotermitis]
MRTLNRLMIAGLAIAGSTAALAQSSVQVYGRINTTVERQKAGDETTTGLYNNSSRIGFMGTEDLGGGLKAGFVLESGFASDTGAGNSGGGMSFNRQSEVNLSGNFGQIRLGHWTPSSYFATADYISMHNHDTGSSADAFYAYVSNDGKSPSYISNGVAYKTPTFGGFNVEVATGLYEKNAQFGNKNLYDVAANYENGPLALGAGYTKLDNSQQFAIRGFYKIGSNILLGGYVQRSKNMGFDQVFGADTGTRTAYRLSGAYLLGNNEFHLNVGKAGKMKNVEDSSALQYTLGYNYNLSKRTKVYGYYTKVNNKAGASYMTGTAGADFSSFAVGVRHNF